MAASVWQGQIVLSLVTIPVKLYAAARAERTHLHQIHNVCHSRLKQPLLLPGVRQAGGSQRGDQGVRV